MKRKRKIGWWKEWKDLKVTEERKWRCRRRKARRRRGARKGKGKVKMKKKTTKRSNKME